jgi:uncharacterized protein (TIGR03067 family)
MKKLLPVVCVVLLLGAEKKEDTKKDSEKLQGTWVVKSAERGGKPVDLDKDEHIPKSITFKGDKFTVKHKEAEHKGAFQIGREDKIGTLDLTPDDADKKDHPLKGLYKVDGDTLTVCVNEGKISERPKEFGAKEGSHCAVVVFTREKSK